MTLYLLSNVLGEGSSKELLPQGMDAVVRSLQGLIAESEKGARVFLRLFGIRELPCQLLNEHTKSQEMEALLAPLLKGETWGVISDAGLPCLADPGAHLVRHARRNKIPVRAFSGPSSITLALMLSGLSGQSFAFHGYLEREENVLHKQLRALEKRSAQEKETQIFIEAPYRNQKMLQHLLATLNEKTLLSVAWDLTLPSEHVRTESVASWRKHPLPDLHKKPAVFLFSA